MHSVCVPLKLVKGKQWFHRIRLTKDNQRSVTDDALGYHSFSREYHKGYMGVPAYLITSLYHSVPKKVSVCALIHLQSEIEEAFAFAFFVYLVIKSLFMVSCNQPIWHICLFSGSSFTVMHANTTFSYVYLSMVDGHGWICPCVRRSFLWPEALPFGELLPGISRSLIKRTVKGRVNQTVVCVIHM